MRKKFLLSGTIATFCLFNQSCYSMFCCAEDEEQKPIVSKTQASTTTNISATTQYEIRMQQIEQQLKEKQTREQAVANQSPITSLPATKRMPDTTIDSDTSEYKIITHGKLMIEIPKNLTLVNNTDGSKSVLLKNIFSMQIFANYDAAVGGNSEVWAINGIQMVFRNKNSVTKRMDTFYNEITEKAEEEDKKTSEGVISFIKVIVDEILEEGPYPVKFGEDLETQTSIVLFRIKDGALFMKGPAMTD